MIVAVIFAMVTLLCIIMCAVMRSKLAGCIINDVKNAYGYAMIDADCLEKSGYKRINAAVIVFSVVFSMYICMVACRTRGRIRKKYDIPDSCGGCGDCCSTYWCLCCTVGQMARHTNDYEDYPVGCCSGDCLLSKTGKNAAARAIEI
jgi:Cys-rich protein (TIGR01571 family)